jgi:hypothetical protein
MISKNVDVITEDVLHHVYTIRITDPELTKLSYRFNGKVHVKIGRPEEQKSEKQNRAAHALMTEFFLTGLHSSPAKNPEEFKLWLKFQIGVCYDYEYEGRPCRVPKSWANYTKRESREFIDALISMVHQSGAYTESERIREIIAGMESNASRKLIG